MILSNDNCKAVNSRFCESVSVQLLFKRWPINAKMSVPRSVPLEERNLSYVVTCYKNNYSHSITLTWMKTHARRETLTRRDNHTEKIINRGTMTGLITWKGARLLERIRGTRDVHFTSAHDGLFESKAHLAVYLWVADLESKLECRRRRPLCRWDCILEGACANTLATDPFRQVRAKWCREEGRRVAKVFCCRLPAWTTFSGHPANRRPRLSFLEWKFAPGHPLMASELASPCHACTPYKWL